MVKHYIEKIEDIIQNEKNDISFKSRLQVVLDNFFNLKLEIHIRNLLVEIFNKNFESKYRAMAEYPRYTFKNRKRVSVDFSILKDGKTDFTMEMKYNFPTDDSFFSNYSKVIDSNFINRKWNEEKNVDAFLLIVGKTDKRFLTDIERDCFEPPLNRISQYQLSERQISKNGENFWEINLEKVFKHYGDMDGYSYKKLKNIQLTSRDKLNFEFQFYFLFRDC